MTEIIQNASDDQIALALCFAAVTISGLVMYFSYHVGTLTRGTRPRAAAIQLPSATTKQTPIPRDRAA